MKYWKYALIIAAGLVISAVVVAGLDANNRFIPPRMVLRAIRVWENIPAWFLPVFDKVNALKPARVEVEPGVTLLLDPQDFLAREILISGTWQPEVWQSIADSLPAGAVFFDVGAHIGWRSSMRTSPRAMPPT